MSQTQTLIKDWLSCKQRKEDAEREASSADCNLTNAINALGKRLLPGPKGKDDALEEVSIWLPINDEEEQMLVVSRLPQGSVAPGDFQLNFVGDKRKI